MSKHWNKFYPGNFVLAGLAEIDDQLLLWGGWLVAAEAPETRRNFRACVWAHHLTNKRQQAGNHFQARLSRVKRES